MKKSLSITSGSIHATVWRNEVIFEIDEFCIENTAKRIYQRLAKKIFLNECPDPELKGAVELLRSFLEQEDFSAIRTADEELAGGHNVRVQIFRNKSGKVQWSKV